MSSLQYWNDPDTMRGRQRNKDERTLLLANAAD